MSGAAARPADAASGAPPRTNAVVAVPAPAGIVVAPVRTLVTPIAPEPPARPDAAASDTARAVTATGPPRRPRPAR
ncbi:hypothetical protein SUDANB6_05512 [Streptomyces sp. enrichment culture]|uniref:hypothetical protein n=1 Tax=Streptomyces sp. enrichment culture TaxID=1795815 RepID=UPI003F57E9B5